MNSGQSPLFAFSPFTNPLEKMLTNAMVNALTIALTIAPYALRQNRSGSRSGFFRSHP